MADRRKFSKLSVTVRKSISLPVGLARRAEKWARAEGKTLSGIVQDALRQAAIERRLRELHDLQGYWSGKAQCRRILREKDLARYLRA